MKLEVDNRTKHYSYKSRSPFKCSHSTVRLDTVRAHSEIFGFPPFINQATAALTVPGKSSRCASRFMPCAVHPSHVPVQPPLIRSQASDAKNRKSRPNTRKLIKRIRLLHQVLGTLRGRFQCREALS